MENQIIRQETLNEEQSALAKVSAWIVASNEDYASLDAYLVGLLRLERMIDADFEPSVKAAHQAHKAVVAQRDLHKDKVSGARAIGKQKIMAWEKIKREEAEVEQRRLEAIAKKQAEDAALEMAAEAERSGDKATATAIISAPVYVEPVVMAPTTPKRQTKIPEAWGYRIINQNLVPREFMTVDAIKLGGMARATKGAVKIPGVSFYDKNAAA